MESILRHCQASEPKLIAFLRELVECESPSDDEAALGRFIDLFTARIGDIATFRRHGLHLLCEFRLPIGKKRRQAGHTLAVGHSDTVHPLGTLASMPWKSEDGKLCGPGVLDMKAGLAQCVFAARALVELDVPVWRQASLWMVADEETGSRTSRALTEKYAKKAAAVLVLEPGTGIEGKLKTERKGVGLYTVHVQGRAAHAGVDFEKGASAVVELARQITAMAEFTDLTKGLTVNPGVIQGGTRSNVIAEEASVEVDIRIARLKDFAPLDRRFQRLKAQDKRCVLRVEGGLNRPPMERTKAIAALFAQARGIAAEMGLQIEESATGGGSDGNFTAALGVPTLDGVGAVGLGAHTHDEFILESRLADRTALLAGLLRGQ